MNYTEELRQLIRKHSIRIVPEGEEFTLSSGKKSRIYCDLKKTVLRSGNAMMAVAGALRIKSQTQFGIVNAYAGVALGGCHLASVAALDSRSAHAIYVRKEAKQHGTQQLIEAPEMDKASSRVVLLEDVTTTAGSAQKALNVLIEGGYDVVGIVTVVDRRTTYEASPERPDLISGVPIRSLFRLEELYDGPNPDTGL